MRALRIGERLHQRYFAALLALLTFAVAMVGTVLLVHYEHSIGHVERLTTETYRAGIRAQFETRARSLGEVTAAALATPLALASFAEILKVIETVAEEPDVMTVAVFDPRGAPLIDETGEVHPSAPAPGDDLRAPAVMDEVIMKWRADRLQVDAPIGSQGRMLGCVRIELAMLGLEQELRALVARIDEIDEAARTARLAALAGLLIAMIALAALFAITVARNFSRPIERLAALTDGITRGDRPLHFPTTRADEVGTLARALARLVDDLDRTTVSRDKFDQILASMRDGLMVSDATGRITDANQALLRLLRVDRAQVLGQPVRRFLSDHPGNPARALDSFETGLKRHGLGPLPVLLSSSPITGEDSRLEGAVYVVHDITERKRAEARVQYLAHHDVLTGLANRALLADRIRQMIALGRRESRRMALLLLDLDRFKTINDTFGHTTGDQLLKEIAARIQATIRETDTAARFGGDEFVVIQLVDHLPRDVEALCSRLMDTLAPPFDVQGVPVRLSLSAGIAIFPRDGEDLDGLLRAADRALYEAKSAGRSTWRFVSDPPVRLASSR